MEGLWCDFALVKLGKEYLVLEYVFTITITLLSEKFAFHLISELNLLISKPKNSAIPLALNALKM